LQSKWGNSIFLFFCNSNTNYQLTMHSSIKQILWKQFGASIDMLENAIVMCPEAHWDTDTKFWYKAYHCLFFLDYYLTLEPIHFAPPPPFTLSEFEDEMPERVYTKTELLQYLHASREKCHLLIAGLSRDISSKRWINESWSMNYSMHEILLYNMRHVQHHAAQLNLLLRQAIDDAPRWIKRSEREL
jgi:hypothetical protein